MINFRFMNTPKILLSLIIIFFSTIYSFSQDVDSIYGLNPILYNGQLYTYYVPSSVSGNQYLHNKDFHAGIVNIKNTQFDNVLLNYDIYNQEVVLLFELKQRLLVIKLLKDKINNFLIGNEYFELIQDDQSDYIIYQVIGDGNYKILYRWQKWLKLSTDKESGGYLFTKPIKTTYLKINNEIFKYRNNRTFLSLMEDSKKQQVKKYLKQNKINVRRASDNELSELIKLCNSL